MITMPLLERPIVLDEAVINELVIENKAEFVRILSQLFSQYDGEDGDITLSENDKVVEISQRAEIITDPFNLDFSRRKITTKLIEKLKEIALSGERHIDTMELLGKITSYLANLCDEADYEVEFNTQLDVGSLLKMADVRAQVRNNTFFENIVDYMIILNEFCNIDCFIFVNLKTYLNDEQLEKLKTEGEYRKLKLLLLENTISEAAKPYEKRRIIDNDLCELT